ncbi:MAG: OmpA family protein [Cocleimonas sp.]
MNNIKSKLIIPITIGFFTLAGCSQQAQNDPNAGVKSTTSTMVKKGATGGNKKVTSNRGSKKGTLIRGGASTVGSSYKGGARGGMNRADGSDLTLAGLKDPNNLLSQRIIYFDYDKAAIRPEFMVVINTHAKLAAKFPQLRMRLEGHADERGSREYNVALSENRAKSVRRIMGTQGARASQIRTIGYGEEVPIVAGKGERSWQKNRRVEIKYDKY